MDRRRARHPGVRLRLRTRLLLLLAGLLAVGLVVADVVTYSSLDRFLAQRTDQELAGAVRPTARALALVAAGLEPPPDAGYGIPPGTYGAILAPTGRLVAQIEFTAGPTASPPVPELPAAVVVAVADEGTTVVQTVAGLRGGGSYRLLAQPATSPPGDVLVVAVPLSGVDATLSRLLLIELLAGALVLVALLLVGYLLVRVGLRPLDRMAAAADGIAAGDLSRRVEPADPRTEVGRLANAINEMLGRIEGAFAERRASEERLRRFVADASHELRTPLTSIRGYAEMFRRGLAEHPEDLAAAMDRIASEAARMSSLVDDLLLLAQLDQGRPLARDRVELGVLAADAARDAQAADPARAVTAMVGEGDHAVIGDEARLRQVVANLVTNALVHTPPGTPVEIVVGREDDRVSLSVVDHGSGIDPATCDHLFERFWRADPARSRGRSGGGTGLGLAIVAAVVAAHGGSVTVGATPGGGATFVVSLPAAGPPAAGARCEERGDGPASATRATDVAAAPHGAAPPPAP